MHDGAREAEEDPARPRLAKVVCKGLSCISPLNRALLESNPQYCAFALAEHHCPKDLAHAGSEAKRSVGFAVSRKVRARKFTETHQLFFLRSSRKAEAQVVAVIDLGLHRRIWTCYGAWK